MDIDVSGGFYLRMLIVRQQLQGCALLQVGEKLGQNRLWSDFRKQQKAF